MKILLRSLLILSVFSLIAGMMIVAVKGALAVAASMGLLEGISEPIRHYSPQASAAESEFDGYKVLSLAGRWILSMGKNTFVISILVAAIVFPRNVLRKLKNPRRT
ncbi:MAG: hypothetical protein JNM02_13710 [Anaerolineales bacterium]|nr:hypothetical protein [Anaerolineales bacterium]